MKLDTENAFTDIATLMQKIGAQKINWIPGATAIAEIEKKDFTYDINAKQHPEILEHLFNNPQKLIALQGKQCLLYIPEGIQDKPTEAQPKFHFTECRTIRDMKSAGRLERYAVTNKTQKIFTVHMKIDRFTPTSRQREIQLNVCKNCLSAYNYLGYNSKSSKEKEEIVTNFNIKSFFSKYENYFSDLPTQTNETINEIIYTQNWKKISLSYRMSVNWHCELCGVDLSNHKQLLDTHHRDGVKKHTSIQNLIALCKLCHSGQYQHQHMLITEEEKNIIYELRKHNDEALSKFVNTHIFRGK
jgi:hypothetical protein